MGHGAYLGPDYSAEYLHVLALDTGEVLARTHFGCASSGLNEVQNAMVAAEIANTLKKNRYDPRSGVLALTAFEALSFQRQKEKWKEYFADVRLNRGLLPAFIHDTAELHRLVSFFAWTAWASVANRPGRAYSYTNNFPYDQLVGNRPAVDAYLWSALGLITLLAGIALVLLAFGRFGFLGWKGTGEHIHPEMMPGSATESQKATIKFFLVAALLFLAQVLVGGATAHFRADPATFYGFDLARLLPSNLLRTWHLQLAIFWIATAWIAGVFFLLSR
jgi:nitric oxide reductase subunit B